MTTSSTTANHGPAAWLALAAAPAFALMALASASQPAAIALCGPAIGLLPVDGMTAMYLLMSFFHLPAWLSRPGGRKPSRS
ncbi:hypothetical protein [Sphingosinicella terrae]|uniref:hypothetical protein n=1 Tax=Sphingosinicella terrae TaxID=2172047 RepID=UPI000E0E07EB|nr:hypothetical protein [Sphingosinicella terrae]